MALYTFYPCRLDDTSLGFEAFELDDDAQAFRRALEVLDDHTTASFVVVWCGERKVLTRQRLAPELAALLTRSSAAEAGS